MPFILLIVGSAMLITSIRGTQGQLATQLTNDFKGSHGFLVWITAIFLIGAIGYIPAFKRFSDSLLGLVLLSFCLSNSGLWSRLTSTVTSAPQSIQETSLPDPASGSSGSGSGSTGTIAQAALLAA